MLIFNELFTGSVNDEDEVVDGFDGADVGWQPAGAAGLVSGESRLFNGAVLYRFESPDWIGYRASKRMMMVTAVVWLTIGYDFCTEVFN